MQKSNPSDAKSIVLDVQTILIPGAILLAGFMISVSVFLGLRRLDSGDVLAKGAQEESTSDKANAVPSVVQPSAQQPAAPSDPASTTIDDDPYQGDRSTAKVAIVEFTDFECPFCKRHHNETYPDLIKNYVDKGKAIYVVRDMPLSFHDPAATKDAFAAECVHELGDNSKYFEFIDELFNTTAGNGGGLTDDKMAAIAEKVGVDKGRFSNCLSEERFADEVQRDASAAGSAGISGTPGFIIGKLNADGSVEGIKVAGAYPYATFSDIIEGLL